MIDEKSGMPYAYPPGPRQGEKITLSAENLDDDERLRARASEITVRGIELPPGGGPEKPDDRMRRLERKARAIRARLLRTLDVLDERRHQIQHVKAEAQTFVRQARSLAKPIGLGLLGASALAIAGVYFLGHALLARRRRSLSWRVSNTVDQLRRGRPPALGRRLVERLVLTVGSIIAAEIAKRSSRNLLEGRDDLRGAR